MKTDREYAPTSQELNKTFKSLTTAQKLQFETIMNMMTALLVSVYQTSRTERKDSNA